MDETDHTLVGARAGDARLVHHVVAGQRSDVRSKTPRFQRPQRRSGALRSVKERSTLVHPGSAATAQAQTKQK